MDSLSNDELPVHQALLKNDILIIENLDLTNKPIGKYRNIFIIPLNIPGVDGIPVRAFGCK